MEIERDVRIENGGNLEVGFQVGLRPASTLPDYSDQELQQALGNLNTRIQKLFRDPPDSTQGGKSGSGNLQPGP